MNADELVATHTNLVWSVVNANRRLCHDGYTTEDAYQAGVCGLLRAAACWRPAGGASFTTWAWTCIAGDISNDAGAFHGSSFRAAARRHQHWHGPVSIEAPAPGTCDGTLGAVLADAAEASDDGDPRLAAVLALVTDDEATVLLFSAEHAAEHLGITGRSVHRRRAKILDRLRAELATAS